MRTTIAGPKGTAHVGDEIDISDSLGAELVAGGYAELLDKPPSKLKPKSTAMLRGGSERAGGEG